ncbi:MAG: hypothetical protein COA46_08775 [Porticoccaceae bacterium]|nr:MAG: hypothetical protein COA46_08775 [Porticoccaceae bacterium]
MFNPVKYKPNQVQACSNQLHSTVIIIKNPIKLIKAQVLLYLEALLSISRGHEKNSLKISTY